jgi:hypothetical protein
MTMTAPTNTAWPAALTNAAWQKKKSFLDKAKSKTKTGLGAELTKAEAAWKQIDFKILDATKQVIPTAKEADNKKAAADTHLKTVVAAASKAALAAAKKAAETKNNTALSSTARKTAAAIEKGLLNQARLIKTIKLTDFDAAKDNVVQLTFQTNLATLKRGLESADRFIAQVETTPTRDTFNRGVQNATRPLLVALGNIGTVGNKPDPRPLGKPLEPWADGKDLLEELASPQMERKVVGETIKFYKKTIASIKQWAA